MKKQMAATKKRVAATYGARPRHVKDGLGMDACHDIRPMSAVRVLNLLKVRAGSHITILGCGCAVEYIAGVLELRRSHVTVTLCENQQEALAAAAALLVRRGARTEADGVYSLTSKGDVKALRGVTVTFHLKLVDLYKLEALPTGTTHVYSTAMDSAAATRHVLHLVYLHRCDGREAPPVRLALFQQRFRDVHLQDAVTDTTPVQLCVSSSGRTVGVVSVQPRPWVVPPVGARVRARWQGDAYEHGVVRCVGANATLEVDFDDGQRGTDIKCFEWELECHAGHS